MADQSSSFIKRALSSVVLVPLLLFILYLGSPYTDGLLMLLFVLSAWEWSRLCLKTQKLVSVSLKMLVFLGGFFYIGTSFYALLDVTRHGAMTLFGILIMVWASDTGAYLVGSLVGGPKLCPSISPNKTWSGLLGGLILTLGAGYVLMTHGHWSIVPRGTCCLSTMGCVAIVAVVSPLGDLLESWMKRRFGVKDTGNLIPGHGGALDRLDSIIAVGFVLFFFVLFCPAR